MNFFLTIISKISVFLPLFGMKITRDLSVEWKIYKMDNLINLLSPALRHIINERQLKFEKHIKQNSVSVLKSSLQCIHGKTVLQFVGNQEAVQMWLKSDWIFFATSITHWMVITTPAQSIFSVPSRFFLSKIVLHSYVQKFVERKKTGLERPMKSDHSSIRENVPRQRGRRDSFLLSDKNSPNIRLFPKRNIKNYVS